MNRDDLALDHTHLADHAIWWGRMKWPAADPADLCSWAYEGLLVAARTWDPDGEMTFTGWARTKIRWTIIDRWRSETHRGARTRHEYPFDHMSVEDDDQATHSDELVAACCSVDLGYDQVIDSIHAAATIETIGLTERERYVVVELGSGTSLRDIGAALGVSEARVSQIRKAIYDRLPVNQRRPSMRTCTVCGAPFPAPPTRREVCSARCARDRKNRAAIRARVTV